MSKKKTTEEFTKESKRIHGNKYDYSKVKYESTFIKVEIKCNKHATLFFQTPSGHLSGKSGCSKCSLNKRLTTEEFIRRSKLKHGETYDYSKVLYKKAKSKVEIICAKHGSFFQAPFDHASGVRCPKCSHEQVGHKLKLTKREFVKKARAKHGNVYDYSNVDYKNSREKVEITCFKHGSFWQSAGAHLYTGSGCRECAKENLSLRFGDKKEDFVKKASLIHGERYNYSMVNYSNARAKVEIVCVDHGSFWQTPDNHLRGYEFRGVKGGNGCPICKSSKGELKIFDFLNKLGVEFESEKTAENCIDKISLRFDFYTCGKFIEYQGVQHYEPVDLFGGEERLKDQQKKDQIKRDYCRKNNLPLLEIRHDNKDWEKDLFEFLNLKQE